MLEPSRIGMLKSYL